MGITNCDIAKSKLITGFLCHVTFYFYSKYTTGDVCLMFDTFYLRKMLFCNGKPCKHIKPSQGLL